MSSQWPVLIVSAILAIFSLFRFKGDASPVPRFAFGAAFAGVVLALLPTLQARSAESGWEVGFWLAAAFGALSWWIPNFGLLQASLLILSGAALQVVSADAADLKTNSAALLAAAGALIAIFHSLIKVPKAISWLTYAGLVGIVAFFSLRGMADGTNLAICAVLGAVGGGVCALLFADEGDPGGLRIGLASILWVGLASVAFSYGKSPGMALACTAGLASACAAGSGIAVTSTLPILAMLLLSTTRVQIAGITQAFEISQHHAIIGLLIGAMAGMLPSAWSKAVTGWRRSSGLVLWLLIGVAAAGITYPFLGQRGVMGFVAGIALIPLVGSLSDKNFNELGGAGATLGCSILLLAPKLAETLDSSRQEKSRLLYISLAVILAMAALLGILGRKPAETNEA